MVPREKFEPMVLVSCCVNISSYSLVCIPVRNPCDHLQGAALLQRPELMHMFNRGREAVDQYLKKGRKLGHMRTIVTILQLITFFILKFNRLLFFTVSLIGGKHFFIY